MSNAGQAGLSIVGGIVGFAIGGPMGAAYGLQLGLAAGTALFPTQLTPVFGPRLEDQRTTTAQVGAAVPITYGNIAVSGTVIWLGEVTENSTTEEVGGKGAPEQEVTTYSYTQSIAIGLCEGEITGVRRIWENGKLLYDRTPQADDESDDAYSARVIASDEYEDTFTLYYGTESQEVDTTIETAEGTWTAYPGLAYIVFPDRQLKEDQALRHPSFRFEIGAPSFSDEYANNVVLDLRMDGEDGSTTFTDRSAYGHAITANGSAQVDTSVRKCGTGSLYVPTGPSSISAANHSSFNVTTQDWTIEAWVYRVNSNFLIGIVDKREFTTLYGYKIDIGPYLTAEGGRAVDGVTVYSLSSANAAIGTFPNNQWVHIALTRSGETMRLFQGGMLVDSQVMSPGTTLATNTAALIVGDGSNSGVFYLDNFRFTNGTARYTDDFDPPQCSTEEPGMVSIAEIIEDVCARCDLVDINVDDLEERYVDGYAIARVMDGASAIEPLKPVGFFDIVETDDQLKFPTRGKAIVVNLDDDDIGAYEYGQNPPPAVSTRKSLDVELPSVVRLHYLATSRDYEDGEQISQERHWTEAVNEVDIESPVAIGDEQAAQAVEINIQDAWAGRWAHSFAVDASYADLEPGDAVGLPVDGRVERVRIVSIDDASLILRRIEAVRDDDGSYVSSAAADDPARQDNPISFYSETTLILLDLPSLQDSDNDAGIYAAACPTTDSYTWNGCVIYRDDAGAFNQVGSVTTSTPIGTIDTAPGSGVTTTWDNKNSLTVSLTAGTLSSRTAAEVLSGANSAAIGSHGRWEIIQFTTATQVDANTWTLSGLLRGRKGTEHNVGLTQVGDRFVLLSGGGVVRLPLQSSQIGVELNYKAVSFGTAYSTGVDQSLTGLGTCLETYSPTYIKGVRSGGDLAISWIRRGRIGQELRSGADIPLSEESESYEVDIMAAGSPTTVLRTLSSSSQSVTYTAAQATADFGGMPDAVMVMVYQLSATVGRGAPGVATI